MRPSEIKTLHQLFTWLAEEELPRQRGRGYGTQYICVLIADRLELDDELVTRALWIVQQRLLPYSAYLSWLEAYHPHIELTDADVREAAKWEGRIAWCKALAEEFRDA